MNRFSLKTLLLAVAFVALAIVATMNANRSWVVAMEALVYLFLATAIVGAIATTGERRMFWAGCAVFGWGLWLAGAVSAHVQLPGWRLEDVIASPLAGMFVEEEVIEYDEYIIRQHNVHVLSDYWDGNTRYYRVIDRELEKRMPEVIRALLVIIAALIGGAIAGWFYRTARKG